MKASTKKAVKIIAIVTIIAIGVGGAVMVFARPQFTMMRGGHRGRFGFMGKEILSPEKIMSHFKEQLDLTEEQEAQILPILEEHMEKQRAMIEKYRGQARQGLQNIQAEHQGMWQELEQQLAGILTEEQMQKVRKLHDERQELVQGMFPARGEFRQLVEDLNISTEQKAELFSIFMKYRDDRRGAMDNALETGNQVLDMVLNEEFDEEKVRQTYRETTAKFEDFVVTRAKMLAEMKAVLNPDQLKLVQEKAPELFAKVQERMQTRRSMMDKWLPHH